MRKVVYATKSEDILRRKEEYDSETRKYSDVHEAQMKAWNMAVEEERRALEEEVKKLIGPTTLKELSVIAETDWYNHSRYSSTSSRFWRVRVRANENIKFSEETSLAWHIEFNLDSEGNVEKDSGSWSGLKVTTPEQIADLEESVRVIKILNSADWATLLERAGKAYEDFVDQDNYQKMRERQMNRPDFEAELKSSEVEDMIANGDWLELSGSPSSYYGDKSHKCMAKVISQTPATYKVYLTDPYYYSVYVKTGKVDESNLYSYTVRKSTFNPLVISKAEEA